MIKNNLTTYSWTKRGLLVGALCLALGPAGAVERTLRIDAPATVAAGQPLAVTFHATTDAGKGEQVGFLQAEVSLDDGKTWSAVCYLQKSGPAVSRRVDLVPGAAGTAVRLRVRAAFRDGAAGDVDFSGAAIAWNGSWEAWKSPPTRHARVEVK